MILSTTTFSLTVAELFKGYEPLIGPSSIQFANGADWEQRAKYLYHTLREEELRSYFPHFVKIAQVMKYKHICTKILKQTLGQDIIDKVVIRARMWTRMIGWLCCGEPNEMGATLPLYVYTLTLSVSLQEKEAEWLNLTADQPVSLLKEVFRMTITGIARSCLGDVFESRKEVDKLADCYHKIWTELEVEFLYRCTHKFENIEHRDFPP